MIELNICGLQQVRGVFSLFFFSVIMATLVKCKRVAGTTPYLFYSSVMCKMVTSLALTSSLSCICTLRGMENMLWKGKDILNDYVNYSL
jgi:hypothetical protein